MGLGNYQNSGDWRWEFYPPPYDFLAPADSAPQPAPVLAARGFGDCGCGCGGGCAGDDHAHGIGLFDSMDPTTWGAGEWTVAGVGSYLAISAFQDIGKGARAVKSGASRARSKVRGAAKGGTLTAGKLALIAAAAYAAYLVYQKSSGAGLGAYQPQAFVNPQSLVVPMQSALIRIPAGW